MFVVTLNSFLGIMEIKTSNQTKEEIAECEPRVTTPSREYEPVQEVAKDVADSEAQSGSLSDSWMLFYHW